MNVEFHTEPKEVAPASSPLKTLGYRSPNRSGVSSASPKEDFSSAIQSLMQLREQAISGDLIRSREASASLEDVALMPEALEELNDGMSLGFDLSASVPSADDARQGGRIHPTTAVGPTQDLSSSPVPTATDPEGFDDFDDDGLALLANPGGPDFPNGGADDSRSFDGGDQWKRDDEESPETLEDRFRVEAPVSRAPETPAPPVEATPPAPAPTPGPVAQTPPAPAAATQMPGYPAAPAQAQPPAQDTPNPWQKVATPSRAEEVREVFESENPFNLNGVDDAAWPKVQQGLQQPSETPAPAPVAQTDPAPTPTPPPASAPTVSVSISKPAPLPSAEPAKAAPTVFFSLSKPTPAPAPEAAAPAAEPAAAAWPAPALPVSDPAPAPVAAPESVSAPSAMVTAEEAARTLNALNTGGRPSMNTGQSAQFDENAPRGFTDIGPRDAAAPPIVPGVEFPESFVEPTPVVQPEAAPAPIAPIEDSVETPAAVEASTPARVESAWPAPTSKPTSFTPESIPPAPEEAPAPEPIADLEPAEESTPEPAPEGLWTPQVDAFETPSLPEVAAVPPANFSTAIEGEEGWSRKVSDDSPEPTVEPAEVVSSGSTELLAPLPDLGNESAAATTSLAGPAAIPSTLEFSQEVIALACPACQKELKVQRENLGVSGTCVSCSHPLVAFETFAGSVSAIKLDASQAPPVDPSKAPTFFVDADSANEVAKPAPVETPSEPMMEAAPVLTPTASPSTWAAPSAPEPTPDLPEPSPEAELPAEAPPAEPLEMRNPWSNPAPPSSIPAASPVPVEEEVPSADPEAPIAFDDLRADQAEPVLSWLKQPEDAPATRPAEGSEAHAEAAKAAFTSLFQAPEKTESSTEPPSLESTPEPTSDLPEPKAVEPEVTQPEAPLSESAPGGFSAAIMDLPKKTTGIRKQLDLPTQNPSTSSSDLPPVDEPEGSEQTPFGGTIAVPAPFSGDSILPERQDASSLTGESIFGDHFQNPAATPDATDSQNPEPKRSGGAAIILTLFVLAVFGAALVMFFIPGMGDQVGKLKSKILEIVPALAPGAEAPMDRMEIPAVTPIEPFAPTPEPAATEEAEIEEFDLGIFDGPVERKEAPSPVASFSLDLPVPAGVVDTLHSGMTPVPRPQPALDRP